MSNLVTMAWIKLKMLARRPLLLIFCILVPILLSLLAGATVQRNNMAHIQAAYLDKADNESSHKLRSMLDASRLGWHPITEGEINRALALGQLDGVVIIPSDYGDLSRADLVDDIFACTFLAGRNTTAAHLVRENFLISNLALAVEAKLQKDLMTLEGAQGLNLADMDRLLTETTRLARQEGAVLKLDIREGNMAEVLPLVQVPDVAIDILFLSVFSLVTSLMLADAGTQRRLRSLPAGFRRDYLATLLALFTAASLQVFLMAGLSQLLMPGTSRPSNYLPVMTVLLLLMLAMGQLVALIPGDRRFVPASLLLFVFVLAGGSLIQLPAVWIDKVGQFTPHGWALAQMNGMTVTLSLPLGGALALALLYLAYLAQKHSPYLAG